MCKVQPRKNRTQRSGSWREMGIQKELAGLCFNVEGLESNLDDPYFHELLNKHDIIILTETWRVVALNSINLDTGTIPKYAPNILKHLVTHVGLRYWSK